MQTPEDVLATTDTIGAGKLNEAHMQATSLGAGGVGEWGGGTDQIK